MTEPALSPAPPAPAVAITVETTAAIRALWVRMSAV